MIGRLEGRLHQLEPGLVLVDIGGVGYLVRTTLGTFDGLVSGQNVRMWIHTQIRDDSIVLFGFPERSELDAFQHLIAVAGVGPRTALAVLSGLTAAELAIAVDSGDFPRLQRAPGVGRKTAERIVLELKGRLRSNGVAGRPGTDTVGDAVSALVNLGYSERDALRTVKKARQLKADASLGELLRMALQALTS